MSREELIERCEPSTGNRIFTTATGDIVEIRAPDGRRVYKRRRLSGTLTMLSVYLDALTVMTYVMTALWVGGTVAIVIYTGVWLGLLALILPALWFAHLSGSG